MPVLPKYQLKELFEAGDLITETTLDEFIEASYNPTLVAGSNITLTTTSTPSGDTITISSTGGGGGAPVIAGPGIDVTTVGTDKQISINLDTGQTNLIINGSDELTFAGVHIKDEGSDVGTFPTINFIGNDVLAEDSGIPGQVNVYVPTPTFASNFNTTNGTTNGECNCNITSFNDTPRISKPTTEGSPFRTGGGANALWAATNDKPAYNDSGSGTLTFTTVALVTGFGGDSTMTVEVYDADGVTVLETFTTPALTGNATHTSVGNRLSVQIASYQSDTSKNKAKPTITIKAGEVLSNNGYDGGRYHVKITHTTDTTTDGGQTFSYFGPDGNTLPQSQSYNANVQDVFFDTDLSSPQINGSMTIAEKTGSIVTKHLSGVEYYVGGSKFEVDVTDIDNFNANTQGRAGDSVWNFRAQGGDYNLPTLSITAWSPAYGTFTGTNWPDFYNASDVDWDYNDWTISAGNFRFRNTDATVNAQVWDPWDAGTTVNSTTARILIDTYATAGNSNTLRERFDDEQYRLKKGASSYITWNSTTALGTGITGTGNASPFDSGCVVGSNLVRADKFFKDNGNSPQYSSLTGTLAGYKPDLSGTNPDYSSYTGTPTYHRLFETTTNGTKIITSFELAFSGDFVSNAFNDLANDDMRIYITKKASPTSSNVGFSAVPHSLHGASYNFANYQDPPTGVDAANGSAQCRTGSTPGNTVSGTFGGSNAQQGFYVEIQLLDPSIRIDQIIVTLNFSDGTQQTG